MSTMNPTIKRILPWAPLIAALIVGLILGLLVGWVWWPVSWTNASLADLSPSQQAAYIGSVVEAYHLDGTQAATRRMEARLAPFGASTGEAVTAAIAYYGGLPTPDDVMVSNLAKLAMDLGIPVDAAMMAGGNGTTDPGAVDSGSADSGAADTAAPAAEAAVVDTAASNENGGNSGILTWLLAVVLSLGLIGAGFYLLMRLRTPSELTDSMKDPSAPPAPGELKPAAAATQTTAWGKSNGAASTTANDDDLSFEDEDEEEPAVRFSSASGESGAPDADDDYTPVTPRYASARAEEANYEQYTGSSYDAADDDDAFDDQDETDETDESDAQQGSPDSEVLASGPDVPPAAAVPVANRSSGPGGGPVPADAPPVDINALTPPSWAAVDTKGGDAKSTPKGKSSSGPAASSNSTGGAAAIAATIPAQASANALSAASSDGMSAETIITTGVAVAAGRNAGRPAIQPVDQPASKPATKQVAQFTMQYHAGLPGYIEAHNITDPATGN